jgi:hypothetical protein
VNQNRKIGAAALDPLRRRRHQQFLGRRHGNGRREHWRHLENRAQRHRRPVIVVVVQRGVPSGPVFQRRVRRQVTMDDRMQAAMVFGLVHVLGRRNREQRERHTQRTGEPPGGLSELEWDHWTLA